jgi:tetratricopeptide (TPR) repeat protein
MAEASGDGPHLRTSHAALFLRLAEEAAPHLQGAESRSWLDRLERDHDNLRAAISRSVARPDPSTAVGLVFALWRFWQRRGYLDEARRLVDRIAGQGWELTADERARFAEAAGGIAYWQADIPATNRWYDEALEIRRGQADPADPATQRELANALYNRGYASVAELMTAAEVGARPDPAAREMLEQSLAIYRALGDRGGEADLLWGLGGYLLFADQAVQAESCFRQSIDLHRASGNRHMEAWSLHMLTVTVLIQTRAEEAGEASRDALRLFAAAGDVSGTTLSLDVLAGVAMAQGQRDRGGRLWGAGRRLQQAAGIGLAEWDRKIISMMPFAVERVLGPAELDRLAAEGAGLTLAETVAYALEEADPFAEG